MSEPVHTTSSPGMSTTAPATVTVPGVSTYVAGAPETPAPAPPKGWEIPPEPNGEPDAEPKPTETVDYWKQRARQNEAQAKANAKAAEKLKEIEDRDLSELQRERRDREALAEENARLKSESARNRVALAKNLDAQAATFLTGSTEEELIASADALLAWRGNLPPSTPRPDPGQGPRPSTPEMAADQEYNLFFPNG